MFIPHRQTVKNLAVMLPFWHELIHQFNKVRTVRWFQQVDHLMQDNVIQAFPGLLGEFRIQAYRPGAGIAAYRNHSVRQTIMKMPLRAWACSLSSMMMQAGMPVP